MGSGCSCPASDSLGIVTVKCWIGNSGQGTLVFPELSDGDHSLPSLQAKPNIGLCLSGGAITIDAR